MTFRADNNKDKDLLATIIQESIQIYGLDLEYWTTSFNENKDKIYAEDTKPLINGRYKIKGYSEIIQEDYLLTRFGFNSDDFLKIMIDVKEFDESVGTTPKAGDYMWVDYMQRLFIVTDIDKEDSVFMQRKFVYSFNLKPANIAGEEIEDIIGITNYETVIDAQNDNDAITEAISGLRVNKLGDISIFGEYD